MGTETIADPAKAKPLESLELAGLLSDLLQGERTGVRRALDAILSADRNPPKPKYFERLKAWIWKPETRNRLWFVTGIAFLWSLSLYLIVAGLKGISANHLGHSVSDEYSALATVLFGASSMALVMLSLVIGMLAVVGWGRLRESIREEVEVENRKLKSVMQQLGEELQGRIFSTHGHFLGETACSLLDDALCQPGDQEKARDLLTQAVTHCRIGYDKIKESSAHDVRPDHPALFMALNNLVCYSAILRGTSPEVKSDSLWPDGQLLRQALILRYAAQKNDESIGSIGLYLTYCWVVGYLSQDRGEVEKALAVTRTVSQRNDSSEAHKREAGKLQISLSQRLERLKS